MENYRILIVEGENLTRINLRNLFEAEGYLVSEAFDEKTMTKMLNQYDISLVIMNIKLSGKNGFLLGREIVIKKKLGLIFIADRGNDIDRILGLELGADDYLAKPFNPRELTIRTRNILRRITHNSGKIDREADQPIITFNEWTLNGNSRELTSPTGDIIPIPRGEYRALRLLIKNEGSIVSRQDLIKTMTGRDLRSNDRTVDVTIRRLRKHFEENTHPEELIHTIYGEGYRFVGKVK